MSLDIILSTTLSRFDLEISDLQQLRRSCRDFKRTLNDRRYIKASFNNMFPSFQIVAHHLGFGDIVEEILSSDIDIVYFGQCLKSHQYDNLFNHQGDSRRIISTLRIFACMIRLFTDDSVVFYYLSSYIKDVFVKKYPNMHSKINLSDVYLPHFFIHKKSHKIYEIYETLVLCENHVFQSNEKIDTVFEARSYEEVMANFHVMYAVQGIYLRECDKMTNILIVNIIMRYILQVLTRFELGVFMETMIFQFKTMVTYYIEKRSRPGDRVLENIKSNAAKIVMLF